LVEVLVVIAVIIPVILAATLGLLTSARLATGTKTSQELNAAAASFAESLKDVAYVDCASITDYDGATGLWEPPPDSAVVIDVLDVEYWDPATDDYATSCASPDGGAQMITIELTVLDGDTQLSVVKRDPDAWAGDTP
jgi:type II secretory pathway pseudopilin PulG